MTTDDPPSSDSGEDGVPAPTVDYDETVSLLRDLVRIPSPYFEAAEITEGRSKTHGTPEDSFQRIANYWNAYFRNSGIPDPNITARDVADLLALMKLARSQGGEHNPDDNRDRVGYISFAEAFKSE